MKRMVKYLVFCVAATAAATSFAQSDAAATAPPANAWSLIADGAPAYAVLRWGTLIDHVQRSGFTKSTAYEDFKKTSGNIDIFNPQIYAPTGIDINAPIVAQADGGPLSHVRVVGRTTDKGLLVTIVSSMAEDKTSGITMQASSTPAGKAGVIASAKIAAWTGIVRIEGDLVVVDLITGAAAKTMTPALIAQKFSVKPLKAFTASSGARSVLGGDRVAALYIDGKKVSQLHAMWAQFVPAPAKQGGMTLQKCQLEASKMPVTFDDIAAGVTMVDKAPELELAWGASAGQALKFTAVDDGIVNSARLRKESVAHLGIYGQLPAVFRALKTTGMPSVDRIDQLIDQCPTTVAPTLLIRSWPHMVAAALAGLDKNPQDLGPMAGLVTAINQLRTVFFALRNVPNEQSPPNWVGVVSATEQFRTVVEGLLGIIGMQGTPRAFGRHAITYYDGSAAQGGMKFVGAIEALANSLVGITGASGDDTLRWAFGTDAQKQVSGAGVPLVTAHMDGALLLSFSKDQEAKPFLQRINRLSAELRNDDLFRAVLRVQLN